MPLQSTKNAELQRKRVLQELGSMLRVQHHPHAVRLLDAFEDARGYHLVMPVLKGEPAERKGGQGGYSIPYAKSHALDLLEHQADCRLQRDLSSSTANE